MVSIGPCAPELLPAPAVVGGSNLVGTQAGNSSPCTHDLFPAPAVLGGIPTGTDCILSMSISTSELKASS